MKKLAVITGGTKGIGRATIERFAKEGFDIITCARNHKDIEQLIEDINERFPSIEIHAVQADLSNKNEVAKFAEVVKSLDRPVDMLLNNTGTFIPGSVHNEEDGNFTTGSIAGIQAYANGGSYSISKFALLGFTKALREEMKPHGVRVTSILAGATYTSSWEGVELPVERFMKAEDIADAIYAAHALSPNTVVEEIILRPQLGDI